MVTLVLIVAAIVIFAVVAAGFVQPHAIRLVSAALGLVVFAAWLMPYINGATHV